MFYLSGRGNLSGNPIKTDNHDEFGWYLEDREIIERKIYENSSGNLRSPKRIISGLERISATSSLNSIFHCNERNENKRDSHNFGKTENDDKDTTDIEEIELNSYTRKNENQDIDLEMIEDDADRRVFTSTIISDGETENFDNDEVDNEKLNNHSRGICYTPERLVRSQEYRILIPSPRYLSIPKNHSEPIEDTSPRTYRGHRRKIGDLIDSKQFGASHLEALLDPGAPEIRLPVVQRRRAANLRERLAIKKNIDADKTREMYEPLELANRDSPETFETPDLVSSRSSYERLAISWEQEREKIVRRSSQDDTSGIHSNDWSTDTPSDIQSPVCLCDELASASRSFAKITESRSRTTAINEVVSILESLERNPDRAALLLEEDRFGEVTSGHDHLTRLALTIEPDGAVPTVNGDPDNVVDELRNKVDRLQATTRNIIRDIDILRRDFECNEIKIDNLTEATIALRRDTSEMRYLDDLLNLLDGELERITRRNWPFIFGHNRAEDMNLVV